MNPAYVWLAIVAAALGGTHLFQRWHRRRTAPAPARPRVPAPPPVPGHTSARPLSPPPRPAPAPGPCSLCGWHQVRCGQCGRKVAVQERCPAHEEAPR